MRIERYIELAAFCCDVMDLLVQNEVENNLPIGILNRGLAGQPHEDWFMARAVDSDGVTRLVALMTPPHNLILTTMDEQPPSEAIGVLIEYLVRMRTDVPGTIGRRELALVFTKAYAKRTGREYCVDTDERVYRLDAVADVPIVGELRLAEARDLHFLPYWMQDFRGTCFHERGELDVESARAAVAGHRYYLLEVAGQPVCLAGTSRQMPHGRSVGPVYTPPYFRGRGYATACVAMLSRLILSWGNAYCVLFTDLANPTSNSIYQKIGYKPICDYVEIRFNR